MSLPGYTICCVRARCWISRPGGLQERLRGEGSEKVAPVTYGRTASASCCGLMRRGGDWALQAQVRLLAENSQQEAQNLLIIRVQHWPAIHRELAGACTA